MKRFIHFLILSCITGALSACSSFAYPERDDDQNACKPGEPTNPRERDLVLPSPSLVDIHLTSSGELVDRCLWTNALLQISNGDLADERSKIVLLHIHGWKENANPENAERDAFRKILEGIDAGEQASGSNRQVVGVFVAWPAATYAIAALNNLTFLSRLDVADRISQSAVVAKLIGSIDNILNHREQEGKDDVFILLGYSLGGRILFNATAQATLYNAQQAYPVKGSNTYQRIDGPGDIIILLNPAISASNYSALDSIRRNSEKFPPDQQPVMLTIASETDLVNQYAYPVSRWITFNWAREQRTAIGAYPPFATHRLQIRKEPPATKTHEHAWFDSFCTGQVCLTRQPASDASLWRDRDKNPTRPFQPSNPFIVAHTSSDVVDGHSDVWTSDVFDQWLSGFMLQLLDQRKQLRDADKRARQ